MTTARLTILVIDDEPEVRALVRQALEDEAFEVIEAATGTEGLARAALAPDLVILDILLPDMSGLDVCARLKADPATRSTPVLLVSAVLVGSEERARGLETGADAYLEKPFKIRELLATVQALLRARRAEERAEVAAALLTLAEAVGGLSRHEAILDAVVRTTPRLVGLERCLIFLRDPGGSLVPRVASGLPDDLRDVFMSVRGQPASPAVIRAAERQEAVAVTAADLEPAIPHRLTEALEIRSMLILPLVVAGAVVGMMTVDTPGEARGFTDKQIAIARGIGAHAALAIDRARTHAESERRRAEAEALADLGRLLSQSLERAQVEQAIVDSIRALLGAEAATLFELEPESGDLVPVAHSGTSREVIGDARFAKGTGVVGIAMAERRVVASLNVSDDPRVTLSPRLRSILERLPPRSSVAAPLLVKDVPIGVLAVAGPAGRIFGDEERRVVQAFAHHAAVAFQNARLFEAERQLRQETSRRRYESLALESVVHQITSSLDLGEVMDRIVHAARAMCEADFAFVAPHDPGTDSATIVAATGTRSESLVSSTIRRGLGMCGKVVETGEPLVTDDYLTDPRFSKDYAESARAEGTIAEAVAPIRAGQRVIGLLAVANRTSRGFTTQEVAVLARLADHAAIALENSRLYGELKRAAAEVERRERRQRAIAALSQQALSGTDLPVLLQRAADTLADLLETEYATVLEVSPDGTELVVRCGVGWTPDVVGHTGVSLDSPAGHVLITGGPLVIEDLASEARFAVPGLLREHGVVSAAAVAIDGFIPPYGVLGVATTRWRTFAEDDRQFLRAMANVLGMAVARTRAETELRRHAERQQILREIDQAILAERAPADIATATLQRLHRVIGCWSNIRMFDLATGASRVLAAVGPPSVLATQARFTTLDGNGRDEFEELRRGQVRVVSDISTLSSLSPVVQALAAHGLSSYARIPLMAEDELIGSLGLASDRPHAFSQEDIDLAREVANPLAVALLHARLHEQVNTAREQLRALSRRLVEVQEQERQHIARELHDEIGQTLTALRLALDTSDLCPSASIRAELDRARTLVADLTTRVRELSLDLRPVTLDDLGLVPTLLWHVRRYTAETGVKVRFSHVGVEGKRFGGAVEIAAYRIVQEALTNVARHAGVHEATVRLWADGSTVGVQVEDRGAGLPDGALAHPRSSGLAGMRERAMLLGGRLEIESTPGAGVRVAAEIPLGASEGSHVMGGLDGPPKPPGRSEPSRDTRDGPRVI